MVASHNFSQDTALLYSAELTAWVQHIDTLFRSSGWQVANVTTYDEFEALFSSEAYWIVVTESGLYTAQIQDLIHSHDSPGEHTTLLVLVTDDVHPPDSAAIKQADLVLPPNPLYIDHQLRAFLRLHDERRALAAEQQKARSEVEALQTEIDKLEKAVQEQRRAKDEIEVLKNAIVRNVSHELRTPLLQVKSAVSLISEDMPDSTLTDYALNATARLETHIRNITMLGQSLDFSPVPMMLHDAIESAKRNLNRAWQSKADAERIQVELEPGLPPVLADRQGLSVALQLLLDNALKFSDDNVIISARRDAECAFICIQDTGIGIAEDAMKHIFDAFFQIDSSSTRRYGGAGVGLALVKLILDRHNTQIEVESIPGKGSNFGFRLRLQKMHKP